MSMTTETRFVKPRSSPFTSDVPAWRTRLIGSVMIHLATLVFFNALLFVVNWMTRGDDGTWWALLPLEMWAGVWTLHVVAVGFLVSGRRARRQSPVGPFKVLG